MTQQPVPEVTHADVERIARRDFGEDAPAALAELARYGADRPADAVSRVRLAALKLAAGDLGRLRAQVDEALVDYRDVLAPAEYPAYLAAGPRVAALPAEERQRLLDADWRQYRQWLTGQHAAADGESWQRRDVWLGLLLLLGGALVTVYAFVAMRSGHPILVFGTGWFLGPVLLLLGGNAIVRALRAPKARP